MLSPPSVNVKFSIEIDPEKTIAGVESGVTLSRVAIRPSYGYSNQKDKHDKYNVN